MGDRYRDNPALAAELLNDLLVKGKAVELQTVLRQLAIGSDASGALALQADEMGTQLYRMLSSQANPEVARLQQSLLFDGMRLALAVGKRAADEYNPVTLLAAQLRDNSAFPAMMVKLEAFGLRLDLIQSELDDF
ncbi:MAG: hypothetical protein V4724_03390 [Pseudomonadota bacterium]